MEKGKFHLEESLEKLALLRQYVSTATSSISKENLQGIPTGGGQFSKISKNEMTELRNELLYLRPSDISPT